MRTSFQQKMKAIEKWAIPAVSCAKDTSGCYDRLLQAIGDAPIVMIGEASHGTNEFYRERALITQRLIKEKGFNAVIVEADWPDAYRINRYVQGASTRDSTAEESMGDFTRFPKWMWRNTQVLRFVKWLKNHNDAFGDPRKRTGFYGMDLYSFITSAHEVINYLEMTDPEVAKEAKANYECFLQYGEDPKTYAMRTSFGMSKPCEKEVIKTLKELRERAHEYLKSGGFVAQEEAFYAIENAEIVKSAEEYYRASMFGRVDSWNLRDSHMVNVIGHLMSHRSKSTGQPSKVVIWAHNSHLGDARATSMGRSRRKWNVGQLLREQYGQDYTFNIGFTTFTGTVSAANNWGKKLEKKSVNKGRSDSWEYILHEAKPNGNQDYLLIFNEIFTKEQTRQGTWAAALTNSLCKKPVDPAFNKIMSDYLLERYIGVIYRPDTELASHYSESSLSEQYDAVIHIDQTNALVPLDPHPAFAAEMEEEMEHTPATTTTTTASSEL